MSGFIQELMVPLQYEYMLRAIWVSALVGGVCGLLSSFVTLKGWSLMGDALSHAVVPGVAIAYIIGLPFALGAFVAAIMATGAMAFIRAQSRIREDATIGIVFTAFFALGLVLITKYPSGVDLKVILYGNIMGIAPADILQVVLISVLTVGVLLVKWKDLMLYCFDANQARTLGLKAGVLHMLLLGLLAATSVAALQAVGAILVLAMLVTPGATAYLLTDRFGKMMWISTGLGVVTSVAGAYASYFINGQTGGCIVTLQTLVFLAAFVFAPKQGMLATRLAVRRGIATTGEAAS
ncbi:MAG: metal ABC transporter permease [Akkermansiaceae bacterium]|jgi:manganese/iron transport system permease protein|nr:metal ABC transporter permease [Akkermansiaceae bacterium]MDP4646563.1 metal ABC transporter permease [Akkermansiaceae bacterium]MDP4720782.1 metal ABC transporter permease [Akkermansiaceae bacterium]MDP4781117.1 metal ABC transporter permease [Akkermansiaceae bacterium]MDP4846440.1 metal ABC transporter permease [Akkermansiaceae bacterium]